MSHHRHAPAPDANDQPMWLALLSEGPELLSLLTLLAVLLLSRWYWQHRQRISQQGRNQSQETERAALQALLSHEIRTPLAAISRLLELAQADPATSQSLVSTAWQATTDLQALLDDLITQSRLQQQQWQLHPVRCELNRLFAELQQIYQPIADSRRLTLRFDLQLGVTHVLVDTQRLRQILHNLLSNALKYTEQGLVEVQVGSQPTGIEQCQLQVSVRDSGIGMSAQLCSELDRPYQQAGQTQRLKYGGQGLGLHLSRQLLRQMGGDMQIDSQPGAGTLIRLTLQLPRADLPDRPSPTASDTCLAGYRVLLVEDEAANRLLLARSMQQWDIAVTVCKDGQQALCRWLTQGFDMVLIDRHLPGMSGPAVCRAIRRIEQHRGTEPVTIIGMTTGSDIAHSGNLFNAWLEKPVAEEALLRMLRDSQPQAEVSDILNLSVLGKLIHGDQAFGKQFLATARQSLQGDLRRLAPEHCADRQQLAETLHHLQGVMRLICTVGLVERCQKLIQSVQANKPADIQAQLPLVKQDLCRVCLALLHCPPDLGHAPACTATSTDHSLA